MPIKRTMMSRNYDDMKKRMQERIKKAIREKAISEFAEAICKRAEEESTDVFFPDGLHGLVIEIEELKSVVSEIAERMKEGAV